jgi:putative ABC transport system ATP-binding protein
VRNWSPPSIARRSWPARSRSSPPKESDLTEPAPPSRSGREPVIRLDGISRSFEVGGQPVHALIDVTIEIGVGEHVAIMGPSGSGKSTLLNIIGCLDKPSRGSYQLSGREVGELDDAALTLVRRNEIGFVFQFFHLIARLDAEENVELPMVFAGVPRGERRERARRALESVGLTQRADHRPDQLSGGERQRVALARATAMRPTILLADEPTGNLDSRSGKVVLDLLDSMNDAGLTLVVVTHDPRVAARADHILLLADGRVVKRLPGSQANDAMAFLTSFEDERARETGPAEA